MVAEEVLVRAWSNSTFRSTSSILVREYQPGKWVFLVGCFNSGTTILQKILGSHPEISGLPREGVRFTELLSNLEENGHHMLWDENFHDYIEPEIADNLALQKIKKDWSIFWKSDSSVFLDKSIANTARIEWLNRVFPNAYFIGIYRNGYCVTEGLRRRAKPPEWYKQQNNSETYSYQTIANQWLVANQLIQDKFKSMPNSLSIRFEDLVANPFEAINSCLEFLELESNLLTQNGSMIKMGDKEFEIHDPNPASLERLGEKGKLESKLILEPMMRQLGYEV